MWHTTLVIGNLGREPEFRYTPNGNAVCNLNVAANRKYKSGEEVVKETTWYRVAVWGKQAENCHQYLKKGSLVLVIGHLSPDKATGGPRVFTRQDGTPGAAFELIASEVRFLSSNGDGTHSEVSLAEAGGDDNANIPF